jgi:hypothetical protein
MPLLQTRFARESHQAILTHKLAMELALPDTAPEGLPGRIERHIACMYGVSRAGYSSLMRDVLVVEFDPGVTSATAVFQRVSSLCPVKRKVQF